MMSIEELEKHLIERDSVAVGVYLAARVLSDSLRARARVERYNAFLRHIVDVNGNEGVAKTHDGWTRSVCGDSLI